MFGRRYFGGAYFGSRYWGQSGAAASVVPETSGGPGRIYQAHGAHSFTRERYRILMEELRAARGVRDDALDSSKAITSKKARDIVAEALDSVDQALISAQSAEPAAQISEAVDTLLIVLRDSASQFDAAINAKKAIEQSRRIEAETARFNAIVAHYAAIQAEIDDEEEAIVMLLLS